VSENRGPAPAAILFACKFNAIRSPMAAGLMQLRFGATTWIESCGAYKGEAIDPFVVTVMEELGVDLSRFRPKTFEELADSNFDLIVTLSPDAHHRALEFTRAMATEVEYWPTFDPSIVQGGREQILDEYRAVRDVLNARIAARFIRPSTG
jgi:protein-tyrosine-phosphatase